MKTGLTKKQKRTSIYFTEADDFVEICTYNTDFKKRLADFAGFIELPDRKTYQPQQAANNKRITNNNNL